MNMKKCSRCKIQKPFSNFTKQLNAKDGLRYNCKSCVAVSHSLWQRNNREYYNKYMREKRANDDSFRIANNLRKRLRKALRKQLTNKTSKTEELLGISFEEFKNYIEFFMAPEMTWKTIDLDHIQPLSSFNLTDSEQLKKSSPLYKYSTTFEKRQSI